MDFKVILQNTGATWAVNMILLLLGFVLLVKGADFFVDGASGIAKKLNVSSYIIGVTVVAVGTSLPELAVTIVDALNPDGGAVIIGNIIGSNALNILLILGVSSLICSLPSDKSTRRVDMPFLLFSSVLFLLLGVFAGGYTSGKTPDGRFFLDGTMPWYCGLILLLLYLAFTVYNIILAKKQSAIRREEAVAEETAEAFTEIPQSGLNFRRKAAAYYGKMQSFGWFLAVISVLGLATVIVGAQLVVDSATVIAQNLMGIPTEIVAMTVVAFGTSLPELVTSVSAAKKGDVGIATGNIIGSNIANLLLIGGVGALCSGARGIPFTMEGMVGGIVSVLAALSVFGFSVGSRTKSLGKTAGAVMLAGFVLYYGLVFLNQYVLFWYLPSDISAVWNFNGALSV